MEVIDMQAKPIVLVVCGVVLLPMIADADTQEKKPIEFFNVRYTASSPSTHDYAVNKFSKFWCAGSKEGWPGGYTFQTNLETTGPGQPHVTLMAKVTCFLTDNQMDIHFTWTDPGNGSNATLDFTALIDPNGHATGTFGNDNNSPGYAFSGHRG